MRPSVTPDGRHDSVEPEQRLWAAVIVRAITDALWRDENPNGSPRDFVTFFSQSIRRRQANQIRDEAIFWLTMPNATFADRCIRAGLDPDMVRSKVRKMLDGADTDTKAKALATSLSLQHL